MGGVPFGTAVTNAEDCGIRFKDGNSTAMEDRDATGSASGSCRVCREVVGCGARTNVGEILCQWREEEGLFPRSSNFCLGPGEHPGFRLTETCLRSLFWSAKK